MHIPEPARKRLIQLAELLPALDDHTITSGQIQALTGWTDATVRKDLSYLLKCLSGKQGGNEKQPRGVSNGYKRLELITAVHAVFDISAVRTEKCCVIGLGLFARALTESTVLTGSPFTVAAGFDSRLNRVETLKANFPLYHTAKMETIIKNDNIQYAIITPDEKNTQDTANRLAACGIKGIVNYGTAVLLSAKKTKIENLSLLGSLRNLAC